MIWKDIIGYLEDDRKYADVAKQMAALGDVEEVASGGRQHGWGHHELESIVRTDDGAFYAAESSGCSCGASGSLHGPFPTYEQALAMLSNYFDELPKHLSEQESAG